MSFLTILALAFGMSMDAFAAAIAQGAAIGTPTRRGTLRTAAVFGSVETLTYPAHRLGNRLRGTTLHRRSTSPIGTTGSPSPCCYCSACV